MDKYVKELLGGSLIYGISGIISIVVILFLVSLYVKNTPNWAITFDTTARVSKFIK